MYSICFLRDLLSQTSFLLCQPEPVFLQIQYNCYCSVAKLCPVLCDPMDYSMPGSSVLHCLPEFALILCHPLCLLPSVFPSIRVFSKELAFCIKWPKYWIFSTIPSNDYSRLISFTIKKAREFQKNIYFCFIDYAKAFDCVDHNRLENAERDGNTRPPDLPFENSVCRSGSNSQNWS